MHNSCVFCAIVEGDIPCHKIGENGDFLCFLDIKPINEGHALVIPKRHFKDVMEFPEDLDRGYFAFVQEMARRITAAVHADGFNLGMNTGAAAGQVVFHQHTHIIPRFSDDGLSSWPQRHISDAELKETREKIMRKA